MRALEFRLVALALALHALSFVDRSAAFMVAVVLFMVALLLAYDRSLEVAAQREPKMGDTRTVSYAEIRPHLQTGDIVLYSGISAFSWLIKRATRSPWSHVAMIVRDGDSVLAWESGRKGVLLNDFATEYKFSERLMTAVGAGEEVVVRQLVCDRTEDMLSAYRAFRAEAEGRPFETNALGFLKAAFGIDLTGENLSALFCSELIAETWQRMLLLTDWRDSDWFSPKDFSSQGSVDRLMLQGQLMPEVRIIP